MIQKHAFSSQLAPHQVFVNTSQRQRWSPARPGVGGDRGAHLRFSALTWSSSQLTAVAAPDQGCSLLCHVPQRSFVGSADSVPSACVFALASSRCSLLSPLLPVFDSILLSHCLLLVPGGAEYRLALEEIPGGCVRLLNGGLDELSCLS